LCSPDGQGKQAKEPDTELILGLPTPSRSPAEDLDAELTKALQQEELAGGEQSQRSTAAKDHEDPWSRGDDPWSKREDSASKERVDPWSCGQDPWSSSTGARSRSKEVYKPSRVSESSLGENVKAEHLESICASGEISKDLISPHVDPTAEKEAESSKAAPSPESLRDEEILEGGDAENIAEQSRTDRTQFTWERYLSDDGNGAWWWCAKDGNWFMEDSPDPWCKYMDPVSQRCYWYRDEEHATFWADSGSIVA
jgi:hypothetical protein